VAKPDGDAMETGPEARLRVVIGAAISELVPASERVRSFLCDQGVDNAAIFAIETAIEELGTNAIKYAFAPSANGTITIEAIATPKRAGLLMEDDGNPFNPTEAPVPQVARSLEEMPIGGLGIHLVRALTDAFSYKRINNRNQMMVWILRET
jgi:anti-sigma regulatory factor (Ser/Thr protein kinase)